MSSAVNLCCWLYQFVDFFFFFGHKVSVWRNTHHGGSMLRAGKTVACSGIDQVQNLGRLACTLLLLAQTHNVAQRLV